MMDCNYAGQGIKALTVESSSLDLLIWYLLNIKKPVDVHVVAPNLKNSVLLPFLRKFTMSLSAPKLEGLYLECYLEDSIVGCAENERWCLYELKLEMGSGIGMASGRHDWQHILSLYIDNVMVSVYIAHTSSPFCSCED